jgi:branched-chain amino acid transport system permease protein
MRSRLIDQAQLIQRTLPGLLLERARRTPERIAYRAKELGIYRETTWRGLAERVTRVALALRARGLQPRQTVAIMGHASPEWTIADLAVQTAGGVTYGIYPTVAPAELARLLGHGGARFMVAEDQESLDRVLAVGPSSPGLETVFVMDTRALFMYREPRVVPFARLEEEGHAPLQGGDTLGALEQLAAAVHPEDMATIVYTSGTTDDPKGAVLLHGRHIAAAANMIAHYPALAEGEHRVVAFLPLSHVMGRNATITLPLITDIVPHYAEDVEAFVEALFEVAPTFLFTVPRYLQKFASALLVGLEHTSVIKRAAYRAAMAVSRAQLRHHWRRENALALNAAALIARGLVFRWLLDKVGLAKARFVLSSGAPLPVEVAVLWQMWGVNVLEAYGQTEMGGAIISGQRGARPRPGDVGPPAPGIEVRLGEDGEVLTRVALAAIGALALNLLTGMAGQVSLGHAGFLAAGAFTVGLLAEETSAPPWLTLPAAAVVGGLLGLIVGAPSLRLKGLYLALGTLALHYVVLWIAGEYQARYGFHTGVTVPPLALGPLRIRTTVQWYYVLLGVAALGTVLCVNLTRSRVGRAWMAVRDREIAAASLGIAVARYKLLAFVASAVMTSLAGAIWAYHRSFVSVEAFGFNVTIEYIAMVIIGGLGSVLGALIGAAFVTLLPYLIDAAVGALPVGAAAEYYLFPLKSGAFGLLMALFLLFEPQGLVGIWQRVRNWVILWPLRYRPLASAR